jgi:phosphotransferase system enzyme I (PtsI)
MIDRRSDGNRKNIILTGSAAAPGMADGSVRILRNDRMFERPAKKYTSEKTTVYATDPEKEIEKLTKAIGNADHFLRSLTEHAASSGSSIDQDLLEMHRLILNDPGLKETIRAKINFKSLTASAAVDHVFRKQIDRFENMTDLKIKARALDLYDICNLLLQELDSNIPDRIFHLTEPCIIVADSIAPSFLISMPKDKLLGIACESDNPLSHTAIIAASRKIPAVFNCSGLMEAATDMITGTDIEKAGLEILVNGDEGKICLNPDTVLKNSWYTGQADQSGKTNSLMWKNRKTITADGERIVLQTNILGSDDLKKINGYDYDGIGLFRTEISFLGNRSAPDEEIQLMLYRNILTNNGSRQVVFRTFDLGGEKGGLFIHDGETSEIQSDFRGLELCLRYPDEFMIQLRAILRASAFGSSAVLFPMVNSPDQLEAALLLLNQAKRQLSAQQIPFDHKIRIGAMIETPAGVNNFVEIFRKVDFISIGSNDLARSCHADASCASGFQSESVFDPAVLILINQIMSEAAIVKRGNDVTLCGEIAGRPDAAALWLSMGIRSFSVAPHNLLICRRVFAGLDTRKLSGLRDEILAMTDRNAIIKKLAEARVPI